MKSAPKTNKASIWPNTLSVLILIAYFILMGYPNFVGSEDLGMVMIFEPDEGVPLPYVFDMIKPADNLKQAVVNFVDYNYYFYGFPYFAYSAMVLFPIKNFSGLNNIPVVMLVLRQMVSVLPMLVAVFLLVRMYEVPNRKWISPLMTIFLLVIPGVIQNNFWWHPDGMVVLSVVLTLFFLNKDNFKYGRNFYFAGFICGINTGIKYTGVFFGLTILVYLLWGVFQRNINIKKMIIAGAGFILAMVAGFLLSNPLLIFFPSVRTDYFEVIKHQSSLLSTGFNVIYPKGLRASLPIIESYYGTWIFLGFVVLATILGILQNKNRLLNVLVFTWAIPLTIFSLTGSLLKFQYILPVMVPLFASLTAYLPEGFTARDQSQLKTHKRSYRIILSVIAMGIFLVQFYLFIQTDIKLFKEWIQRESTSPSITFYMDASHHLGSLMEKELYVYHDVRLYVPDESPWETISIFKLLTYDFVEKEKPAILLLMQQRLLDYLNPDVVGVDPELLETAREFYTDADQEQIRGYVMVYRNQFGLAYVRQDVYQDYLLP